MKVYGPVAKTGLDQKNGLGWVEFEETDAVGLVLSTHDTQELHGKKVLSWIRFYREDNIQSMIFVENDGKRIQVNRM